MSGKRPNLTSSLAASLKQAAAGDVQAPAIGTPAAPAGVMPPVPEIAPVKARTPRTTRLEARPPISFYAATRVGKKKVTAAVEHDMHTQLKVIAAERSLSTEAVVIEALNDLFRKYGKKPIG